MVQLHLTLIGSESKSKSICDPDNRCSLSWRYPVNVGFSYFRFTKNQSNNAFERRQSEKKKGQERTPKKYFKNHSTQSGFREQMMEIWTEFAKFKTSKKMAHQIRQIFKKRCVVMLTKERHEEHKRFDRKKIYIQVTETRYKWTWLKSNSFVESRESSVVVTICPLCK